MTGGAYGQRLGRFVGVEAPPTVKAQPLRNADFAVTRIIFADRAEPVFARIEREDAFIIALQRHDIPSHPYWLDGRAVQRTPSRKGQFSLIDLTFEHTSYNNHRMDCLALYFPRKAFQAVAEERGARAIEALKIKAGAAVDDPVIWHLGECLLPALQAPGEANQLFLDYVSLALLAHLGRAYGEFRTVPYSRRQRGLTSREERRAKEVLMANIDGNIALDELAQLCGLSRSHFARAFKVTTGTAPHRWLLIQRVERAKDFLLHSNLPIEQIAVRCGFADQSHLTRVFLKLMNVAPGEWRTARRT